MFGKKKEKPAKQAKAVKAEKPAKAAKPSSIRTGQKVPKSGQYRAIGSKTEVTFVEGKRVPPTSKGATKFVMVDPTKHKNV